MDEQLSAMPFGSAETVVTHYTRLLTRIARISELLTPNECIRLLGEEALTERVVERMELDAKQRVERQARSIGLLA